MADRNSWLARVTDAFRASKPAPVVVPSNQMDVVSQFIANRPVEPDSVDLRKMVDEGYRRNVIIYSCVNEIASSAAAPRVYLRDRKSQEEVDEHELLDLIARPFPGGSWYDLVERLLIYQQVTGTGYLHKGRSGASQIVQLTAARSDRIQPVPDKQGNILYYEYKIEGGEKQRVEPQDLAAFRLPDPLNDFHGLSPLTVAAVFGDIDTAAAIYLRDFFANGAMPMGLLKFKTPSVRREDRLRVQQEWSEQYGGTEISPKNGGRWHNVGVIGGDVEFQPLGSEPAQLRLDAVWGMTESRLCATFGVPPAIVQARIGLQFSTYSNQREARRSFWTETLVPIYRRLGDGLTRNVVAEYDEDLELVFDLESIPELQEDLNQRATRATALFLGGVASFNEARALSDLEEAKTDFYAFPGTVTMVAKEDVESGKYFTDAAESKKKAEDALASKAAAPPAPFGEKPPPFGKKAGEEKPPKPEPPAKEGQAEDVEDEHGLPFEALGLGTTPPESEREIQRATESLLGGFSAAVRDAVASSDPEKLAAALADGDWRGAEKAVNVGAFVKAYGAALEAHLMREAEVAMDLHYRHHAGEPRETHDGGWVTIKGHPVFIGDGKAGGGGGGGASKFAPDGTIQTEGSTAILPKTLYRGADPALGNVLASAQFKGLVYASINRAQPQQWADGTKGGKVYELELVRQPKVLDLENWTGMAKNLLTKELGARPGAWSKQDHDEEVITFFLQGNGAARLAKMGYDGYRLGPDVALFTSGKFLRVKGGEKHGSDSGELETHGPLSDARRAKTMHAKWMRDRISSRVKLETKRIDKQIRDVVRSQILNVINGKAEAITPSSIIGHIGLTDRQAATVERARVRLLAEGKLKGNALAKDLDRLRVKLLRERAELIAEHETRLAHSLGQRLAWEELLSEGKLKGGKRHWHKLWVASADERTCGVCMEIDGTETTLDGLFADEFYMPPDPHPRCRCSVVLVETKGGWRSPKEDDEGAGPEETLDHWVTINGHPVLIGGDRPGGGGGGGGALAPNLKVLVQKPLIGGIGKDTNRMAEEVEAELRKTKLPAGAMVGLLGVDIKLPGVTDPSIVGTYRTALRRIEMNSGAQPLEGLKGQGREVIHEVGHHVHLYRMNTAAAERWRAISQSGRRCGISLYGRTSTGEHFAEAFKFYAQGGKSREKLQRLEPKAHEFMHSLWKNPKPQFDRVEGPHRGAKSVSNRYYGNTEVGK